MSGLYSPILEQAGFIKRKVDAAVEQWVAQLDGAMQSWVLSGPIVIPENSDFKYTLHIQSFSDLTEGVLSGTDFYMRFLRQADVSFFQRYCQLNVSGTAFPTLSENNTNPRNGNFNKISIIRNSEGIFSQINNGELIRERSFTGGAFTITELGKFSSSYFDGVIYGFEVEINGVLTNQIPLTNKSQGATQLATVGNVNAFMPNYTDAVWRKP